MLIITCCVVGVYFTSKDIKQKQYRRSRNNIVNSGDFTVEMETNRKKITFKLQKANEAELE